MSKLKYTYNPSTNEYTFSAAAMAAALYRASSPKEKIEAEDARENAERIKRSRKERGL